MAAKIAVLGPIRGQISSTFGKLAKLHAKTEFSFAIVLGDIFAPPDGTTAEQDADLASLLGGDIPVVLPTYFTLGSQPLPQSVIDRLESADGEVCSNLIFLGKRGTTKTAEGVRIVALGGRLDPTAGLSQDKYLPFHTEGDAKALHGVRDAHLLITSAWPAGVTRGSKAALPDISERPPEEECVAQLCTAIQPRYHFTPTSSTFYEREPFSHQPADPSSTTRHSTRFLGVAAPGNPSKAKWLYAFNLDPAAPAATALPSGTTPTPFAPASLPKRPRSPPRQHTDRYRPPKRARLTPDQCFFCLSNPHAATHLVAAIGDDAYLTTARGPLVPARALPGHAKPVPLHLLAIPLPHAPTLAAVAPAEARAATHRELRRFRAALHGMLAHVAEGAMAAVSWEVSRARGVHVHWQWCAVPLETASKGLVEAAFRVEAENEKYPAFEIRQENEGGEDELDEADYFRAWIWTPGPAPAAGDEPVANGSSEKDEAKANGNHAKSNSMTSAPGKDKQLIMHLAPESRFDIQFGRRVVGKLLGLDNRLDWKACVQPEEEETAEVEAFKEAFIPWDFTREE